MSKFSDYAQFTKLRLSAIVVLSAAIGYAMGCRSFGISMDWAGMGWLVLGGFLVTGASNGFNQVIERNLDKLMTRTGNRPLPQGRMSVSEAMIVASVMGAAGVFILAYFMNPLSGILGALALVLYVAAYTPLKQITPFAVFVGALPGAIPPMLGWVAASDGFGTIGLPAVILFAVQFMWQFPHFWAIAWVADDDYKKAGFRLLPTRHRDKSSAFQVVVYSIFLIPTSLLPLMFNMSGLVTAGITLACGTVFLVQALKLYKDLEIRSAQRLMFGSFIYLPVVQLALLIGY
ncbi:MAG: Protoheme IX farnesyltransferase [Bacteroidetes bacterium]|nr:MAG: Protoheme IX farnesyltransferase [Bacteroidota bacterium]